MKTILIKSIEIIRKYDILISKDSTWIVSCPSESVQIIHKQRPVFVIIAKERCMNSISFKQYRGIDLAIWLIILSVFEYLTVMAASRWFPGELYTLSQVVVVLCIVMMRWGGYAAIHAVVGGFVFCLAQGASTGQFAVYCVGNCFAMVALVLFKAVGKEKVRDKFYLTVLFTVAAFCGVQLGRWLVSLVFGGSFGSIVTFFMADSLSLLYAVVVVMISRRVDGLFEDQKSYLIRTEAERRKENL